MQSGPHLHVYARLNRNFVQQGDRRRPQWQVAGQCEKWCPRPFLKCDDSARSHSLRQETQCGDGIGKKLEYEPANHCIERRLARELSNIALHKSHVMQTALA